MRMVFLLTAVLIGSKIYCQEDFFSRQKRYITAPDSLSSRIKKRQVNSGNKNFFVVNWQNDSIDYIARSKDTSKLWLGKIQDTSVLWLQLSAVNQAVFKISGKHEKKNMDSLVDIQAAAGNRLDSAFRNYNYSIPLVKRKFYAMRYRIATSDNREMFAALTEKKEVLAKIMPISKSVLAIMPSICNLYPYVSYVGDQKGIYSCSAWAVAGLASMQETILSKKIFSDEDKEHKECYYSPSYIFTVGKQKANNSECDVGIDLLYALSVLESAGIPHLDTCPYFKNDWNCSSDPITENITRDAGMHIYEARNVNLNILDFQYALSHNSPVAMEVSIDNDFEYQGLKGIWTWNKPFIWTKYSSKANKSERKPHSMICIGYNDFRGAFLMLNSQGRQFGYNGTFWIDYRFIFKTLKSAYRLNSSEYISKQRTDKEIIDKINTMDIGAGDQIKAALMEKSSAKRVFDFKIACSFIEPLSEQVAVHLNITDDDGKLLRADIPVSYEICSYFSYNKYNYYIQLESIDEPRQLANITYRPAAVNLIITRLPAENNK